MDEVAEAADEKMEDTVVAEESVEDVDAPPSLASDFDRGKGDMDESVEDVEYVDDGVGDIN